MTLPENIKLKTSPEEGQSPQQKDRQRGKNRKAERCRPRSEGKIEEIEEPERYSLARSG